MIKNKAACKRAFALGTVWNLNHVNGWTPGPRPVVVNNSNSVGFKSEKGISYARFDQTEDQYFISEDGNKIEIRDAGNKTYLTYTKVTE